MKAGLPAFKKYIFVCENERPEGDCCNVAGQKLREHLKQQVKKRGLAAEIRVSRAGCLDVCREGPNVLLMPDNIWFRQVSEKDIETILNKAGESL